MTAIRFNYMKFEFPTFSDKHTTEEGSKETSNSHSVECSISDITMNRVVFSYLLILLFHKIGDTHEIDTDDSSNCKTPNLKPWIHFPFGVCLHIIVNDGTSSICHKRLIDSLTENGVTIYQKSSIFIKNRSISNETKTNCELYLLVVESPQQWFDDIINHPLNKSQQGTFFPFSRLYILSLDAVHTNLSTAVIKYLYRNAIFGYQFRLNDNDQQVVSIHDISNNLTMESIPNHTDISHPLLDTNDHRRIINVSVYSCPPHIFHLHGNENR